MDCWLAGGKVRKAIGFEDSPHERKRAARGCQTFAIQEDERDRFELWFPLQDWGWNRARCEAEIAAAGLPVPSKSSCYFCTAIKPHEVDCLEPDKWRRIVVIEVRVRDRHLRCAEERGWPRGPGVPLTEGLWRRAVKGCRGATPKPGSMTEYIRQRAHVAQWEFYLVTSGTGKVRSATGDAEIAPGDAFMFQPGEAHQIANTGTEDLIFLVIADNPRADVINYPDSGKLGLKPQKQFLKPQPMDYFAGDE